MSMMFRREINAIDLLTKVAWKNDRMDIYGMRCNIPVSAPVQAFFTLCCQMFLCISLE